jgi:hypothetical protein
MMIDFNEKQQRKVCSLIWVKEEGMSIVDSDEHSIKEDFPMLLTELGILTIRIVLEHLLWVASTMDVTVECTVTVSTPLGTESLSWYKLK